MAQTRTVGGRTQYYWNGNWHTVAQPAATGGRSTPAPAVGTTPPASAPQPAPFDATYNNTVGLLNNNLAGTSANIDTAETNLFSRFGLDPTMPNGQAVASDPYSRLNLLKQSFENRRRGSTNGLASRGLLYSGALNNAQNSNQQYYDQSYDALRKAQTDAYAKLEQQRQTAQFGHDSGVLNAQGTSLSNALQSRPSADSLGTTSPTPTPGAPPRPTASVRRSTRGRGRPTGGRIRTTFNTGGRLPVATGGRY